MENHQINYMAKRASAKLSKIFYALKHEWSGNDGAYVPTENNIYEHLLSRLPEFLSGKAKCSSTGGIVLRRDNWHKEGEIITIYYDIAEYNSDLDMIFL
jgi:hypothetical protein